MKYSYDRRMAADNPSMHPTIMPPGQHTRTPVPMVTDHGVLVEAMAMESAAAKLKRAVESGSKTEAYRALDLILAAFKRTNSALGRWDRDR